MGYKKSQYSNMSQNVPFAAGGQVFVVAKSAAAGADLLSKIMIPDVDGKVRFAATLAGALTWCTANRGDKIYIAPGHTESITAAAGIDVNVAGVEIIGIGSGNNRPTFTFSSSTSASILFSANHTTMSNFIGVTTLNGMLNPIDVTGSSVSIQMEWKDTDSTHEAVTAVRAVTTSNLTLDLKYTGFTAGSGVVRAVSLNGITGARIKMDAYGVVSTAWINFVTVLSTNVEVTGTFYTQGITDLSRDVVDTITGSKWGVQGFDASAGYAFAGGSGTAVTGGSLSSLTALLAVPAADASTNANERDVIGNKTDAAVYTVTTTKSVEGYLKGLVNGVVRATGTLTTSSTTVPADTSRAEVDNYWKGCILLPLTGVAALQPVRIASFANTGGVFTLDSDKPLTTAPGTVTYVILSDLGDVTPSTDSTANTMSRHVVGSKADTAVTTTSSTASAMGYLKGLIPGARKTIIKTLANTDMTGTVTRFTVTNGPVKIWSMGKLITTVLPAGANTLKFSFTPTGGAATDLCGATDTASAAAQTIFAVDGTKATGLVKNTDNGILAAGQAEHLPITLSSGVVQTIYSAGAPASGAAIVYMEYEPLSTATAVS